MSLGAGFLTADELANPPAHLESAEADVAPATKATQIIAIYGKGGIGKSFTLANLSYMLAQQGKKVLLIGCDPKSDTTSLLFGGRATPTIIETSTKKKLAGEPVMVGDVCFKRDGDLAAAVSLVEAGRLSLDGLITHRAPAASAADAYPVAFDDPACLKMVLDWRTLS